MGFHKVQVKHRHKLIHRIRGSRPSHRHKPRVQCAFDEDVFIRMADEAEARNIPFGAIVREKVDKAYLMEDMMALTEPLTEAPHEEPPLGGAASGHVHEGLQIVIPRDAD
jgi:hypothetical protein